MGFSLAHEYRRNHDSFTKAFIDTASQHSSVSDFGILYRARDDRRDYISRCSYTFGSKCRRFGILESDLNGASVSADALLLPTSAQRTLQPRGNVAAIPQLEVKLPHSFLTRIFRIRPNPALRSAAVYPSSGPIWCL
jgi:hypothetical protein